MGQDQIWYRVTPEIVDAVASGVLFGGVLGLWYRSAVTLQ